VTTLYLAVPDASSLSLVYLNNSEIAVELWNIRRKMIRQGEFVRLERKLLRAVGNCSEHNDCREGYPVRIKPKPTNIQN
jgi:hypothetical protein